MADATHVTKAEATAIAGYAEALMEIMRMPGWRVRVLEAPCDDDSMATIDWPVPKHIAEMQLNRHWMAFPSNERRETITHEVLHLMHARVTDQLDDAKRYMSKADYKDWRRRMQRELELMVDHLASFMAETHTLVDAWDAVHREARS